MLENKRGMLEDMFVSGYRVDISVVSLKGRVNHVYLMGGE